MVLFLFIYFGAGGGVKECVKSGIMSQLVMST